MKVWQKDQNAMKPETARKIAEIIERFAPRLDDDVVQAIEELRKAA
jgi:predicted component of type VI protein secretion system